MANFTRVWCILILSFFAMSSAVNAASSLYFIALADIHFDPLIGCYGVTEKPCPLLQQLRSSPVSKWHDLLLANSSEPQYRQDTNMSLLQTSLNEAKLAAKEDQAAFVVVLGDSLPHDFRRYYKKYSLDQSRQGFHEFVLKTLDFINLELAAAFPNMSVFMVTGNNDTYSANYQSIPNGEFFARASRDWSALIKDKKDRAAMQRVFPTAGYYAVDVPGYQDLRLIAFNSVLFSTRSTRPEALLAAQTELAWLQQELQKAHLQKQKILIAMHIPPMIDMYLLQRLRLFTITGFWRDDLLKQFKQTLQPYTEDILAIMTGHLHYSWSQWLVVDKHDIPLVTVPSISPIFGNDPAFKVYELSLREGLVEKDFYRVKLQGRR